jgi:hypothetical protein
MRSIVAITAAGLIAAACTGAEGEPSGLAVILRDYQGIIAVILGGLAIPPITNLIAGARTRHAALMAKRVEILDALAPAYVHFIIQVRFVAFDAEEGRLATELGEQHLAEYDAFARDFHADLEILSLEAAEYFGHGRAYASRIEQTMIWCQGLDGVVARLVERGDAAAGAGEVPPWETVRDLTLELRGVYRELLEEMSREVRERRAGPPKWTAAFDAPRLDALRERLIASARTAEAT